MGSGTEACGKSRISPLLVRDVSLGSPRLDTHFAVYVRCLLHGAKTGLVAGHVFISSLALVLFLPLCVFLSVAHASPRKYRVPIHGSQARLRKSEVRSRTILTKLSLSLGVVQMPSFFFLPSCLSLLSLVEDRETKEGTVSASSHKVEIFPGEQFWRTPTHADTSSVLLCNEILRSTLLVFSYLWGEGVMDADGEKTCSAILRLSESPVSPPYGHGGGNAFLPAYWGVEQRRERSVLECRRYQNRCKPAAVEKRIDNRQLSTVEILLLERLRHQTVRRPFFSASVLSFEPCSLSVSSRAGSSLSD